MKISVALAVACLAVGMSFAAQSDASIKKYDLNIPRQTLDTALKDLAQQTGLQIARMSDTIDGAAMVGPVNGSLTPEQALKSLLNAQGLGYKVVNDRTIAIVKPGAETAENQSKISKPEDIAEVQPTAATNLRLAQATDNSQKTDNSPSETSLEVSEDKSRIQEIVVTAQKREQRLFDVPLSVAVISAQDIERRGFIGMEDYLRSLPGVGQVDRGGQDNSIIIRGITTSPEFESLNASPTVATYFGETPITAAGGRGAGGIDIRPVDVERIEVLRGPQGTAYGSSSLGGTLRIIPRKPDLDGFGASLTGALSTTGGYGSDNKMIQGLMNIPVAKDKLAIRVVGYGYSDSGYYRNIAGIDPATITFAANYGLADYVQGHVQNDVGRMRSTGARASMLWHPIDKLDLTVTYLHQKIEQDGEPLAQLGTLDQRRVPIAPQGRVRGDGETSDTKIELANVEANYDLGVAKITATVSRVNSGSTYTQGLGLARPAFGPSSDFVNSKFLSTTAETRFASSFDGPFQILAGFYYENIDETYLQRTGDWPGDPARNPYGTDPMFRSDVTRSLEQKAAFGEASYKLGKFTATGGARHYSYNKEQSTLFQGGLVRVPFGTGVPVQLSSGENGTISKGNLSFAPTKSSLLYVSFSQGFRLGRPDAGLQAATCDVNGDGRLDSSTNVTLESTRNIGPDKLDQYEVGAKSNFGRLLTVEASAFHIDWQGLPIRSLATCTNGINAYTSNVGSAVSDGFELQMTLRPAKGLRVDIGGGYTKAELAADAPGLQPPAKKGDPLPGTPDFSANVAVQRDFDLGRYKAFVRGDGFYVSSFYPDIAQTAALRAGDYAKFDARAGIALNALKVELFVKNIANSNAFTWQGLQLGGGGFRLRPRTVGIQFGYSFGE